MRERNSLTRKVGYGLVIVGLLFVLSWLGAPATIDSDGGVLATLRTENDLSQSKLGDVDPASETIKLATLGLRGVAVQFLWDRAVHFKKVEDWTNLTATLEQLAKLQPNFVTFWKYQSWNLSYNVSVEFDDYNDRYYWVRRGIEFLEDGNEYNRDNPTLLWELGWVLGQKIGRSDENAQYRRLFREDDDFHPEDRPPAQRDNWLVSKEAYLKATAAVDEKGKDLGKKSPSIFYSSAAKSQMNHSEAIEKEGLFDKAVASWKQSGEEWLEFGNVPIQHTQGPILRFNEAPYLKRQVKEMTARLAELMPSAEQGVTDEALAALSEEQRAALDVPAEQRNPTEAEHAYQAERRLKVTPEKIADYIIREAPDKARDAKELAADIADTARLQRFTQNYRDTVAYEYWALRCKFEQSKDAVAARSLIYRAQRVFLEEADPFAAKNLYEEAFQRWHDLFEQFPELKDVEGTTGDDVMSYIYEYYEVLEQLDEQLPEDFVLWHIIEGFDIEQVFTAQIRERAQRQIDASIEKAKNTPTEKAAPADEGPQANAQADASADAPAESPSEPESKATEAKQASDEADATENEPPAEEKAVEEAEGEAVNEKAETESPAAQEATEPPTEETVTEAADASNAS